MANRLQGMQIGFLVANEGVEEVELTTPWDAVRAEGAEPSLIAPQPGTVQAFRHLDRGERFPVDRTVDELGPDPAAITLDAIVLPGGVANPDQLRLCAPAVAAVRAHVGAGRPLAVICHGPWTLVEADVVRDRTLTSWPGLRTDIRNAGGRWVDEPVVVDDNIVSSRKPDDLPQFCAALVDRFERARRGASV